VHVVTLQPLDCSTHVTDVGAPNFHGEHDGEVRLLPECAQLDEMCRFALVQFVRKLISVGMHVCMGWHQVWSLVCTLL
jgi:hypothetical protein